MTVDLDIYSVARAGKLCRAATPRRGNPYEHRCCLDVLETVAHWFDEHRTTPTTLDYLAAAIDEPNTQTSVAMSFLLERGIIERIGRANYPASGCCHLDAMTEYHALREKGPA